MWQRIFGLAIKEFQALLRDPKARMVIIGPPLIQLIVFSFAATFDLSHIPLAVYNQDGGQASHALVDLFTGSDHFVITAHITHEDEIKHVINGKKALMVLTIGPRFAQNLQSQTPATLQLIIDGRNSNTAAIALSYANYIVNDFNKHWQQTHHLAAPPSIIATRAWYNPNLTSQWFIVPGVVGILMLVVVMVVTSLSVAREREQGTFDQLLVTPLRPVEILIGKAIPGFIIGILEASAIILLAVTVFDIPFEGHIFTLFVGLTLFLMSAIGIGLMISALATTLQQAVLGVFLFLVPAIILSGFATPIANMPPLVQDLTLINPMRYLMIILRGVFLEGSSFYSLLDEFWPLAAIGLITLASAGWLFRHRMN
ncbi:MAG: antibiotic ABC transporter permease [Halothiobacillus sp. 13-55-253]|jgi:ABC-2 type transport system permease protein|nr:MAG: antibiotic ABC transporter permease [Halothiobacillus sp. 13-55-253]